MQLIRFKFADTFQASEDNNGMSRPNQKFTAPCHLKRLGILLKRLKHSGGTHSNGRH